MEYYSAIKRSETVPFAETCRDIETVIQNTVKSEKQVSYVHVYMWNLEKWYWWAFLQSRKRDPDMKRACGHQGGLGGWNSHLHTTVAVYTQSCLTLWDPMDCSWPDSSVHEILQARILEWAAMSFSRGSPWPRDRTCVSCESCIIRRVLYHQATWEALILHYHG